MCALQFDKKIENKNYNMIYSMTGFGSSTGQYKDKTYAVEIKTLNAKSSDARLKVPAGFREHEIKIRQYIMDKVVRGKTDVTVTVVSDEMDVENNLNVALFKKYYKDLKSIGADLGIENADYVQSILRIPNVIKSADYTISDGEWKFILDLCDQAVDQLDAFRMTEGKAMCDDVVLRINCIKELISKIDPYEKERIKKLRVRLQKNLNEFTNDQQVDQNRFEQEIIFYIEKLDIHEEKVRLKQHCDYFLEEIDAEELSKGKKLGFLAQEIGREINTIGSKAQYSEIQKIVVEMKNELDQVREQLANVL